MMTDTLSKYKDYCAKGSLLEKGFEYLLNQASPNLADGRVEIEGDRLFALVQSYTTAKPEEKRYEAHDNYIDIQYIVKGSEIVGYAPREGLVVAEDQRPKADLVFFKPVQGLDVVLNAGSFAVFFPQDGHKPCVMNGSPAPVKKIVVKVRYA